MRCGCSAICATRSGETRATRIGGVIVFYLGTHEPSAKWWAATVPLCVSRRRMPKRLIPTAAAPWILDSGGFSELSEYGEWRTSEDTYVAEIERWRAVGRLAWVAPQDWMCEPDIISGNPAKGWPGTHLSVEEHQRRTVASFVSLRERIGSLVIPVLQGYAPREYDRCVSLYQDAGVDLAAERVVGLGSVCRRSRTREAVRLVRYVSDHGLQLHGFGLKGTAYRALRGLLASADSMAWSYAARMNGGNANGLEDALLWRRQLLAA
jgi:hypothetical protein